MYKIHQSAATVAIAARQMLASGPAQLAWSNLVRLALVILTAWVFAISSAAFWAPYAAEEIASEVTGMFSSLSACPLGGLPQLAQFVLCGILPVFCM